MYADHFGLSKNPFQSIAEGEAVFEGTEQTKVIADLKTALTARDSIAVITGPVGVGKTTIVQRALGKMGPERLVAILGRAQVGSDELVDLLLAQFGVVREPTRRFECLKTFNRILNERAAAGARVFIVIEDAERLGADLLEELEALTASDGGNCAGANIILMGPQKLDKLITKPALERMRQRIRLQQTLERFAADEVESYLRHRISAAGGDFDAIFESGASLMIRRCSGGIPRVVNSLCETALTVAAEHKKTQVTGKIIFKVAVEVFGMTPGDAPTPQAPGAAPASQATATPAKPTAPAAKAPDASPRPEPKMPEPAAAEPRPEPQQTKTPRAPKPPANAPTSPSAAATKAGGTSVIPKAKRARIPDLSGLGVQDKDPAAAGQKSVAADQKPAVDKPLPELPPKFKFADEIVVDRDTRPQLPVQAAKQIDPPELPTLDLNDGEPKIAAEKPEAKKAPVPPSAATDNVPTLGDSARLEQVAPESKKDEDMPALDTARPAATPAKPTPAKPAPAKPALAKPASAKPASAKPAPAKDTPNISIREPNPLPRRLETNVGEETASFAKVDHDMLEAALASLAVHDEQDEPEPETEAPVYVEEASESIPEVTLDRSIEAKISAARAGPDAAELDQMAAELEKTKSLEEMSDKLAETLFGSEELEAISLQIREKGAPQEESPAALDLAGAEAANASEVAMTSAEHAPAPEPLTAPKPPADAEMGGESAAAAVAATGPQPELIEDQIHTSMTATLKTLKDQKRSPADDADSEERSGGLLGRLKDTFKS